MKVMHIADLHLDTKYPNSFIEGEYSFRTYDAFRTFNKLIKKANELDVRVLVIAGDIFNRPNVSDKLKVAFIKSISKFKGFIFLIAGQHDLRSDGTSSLALIKESIEKLVGGIDDVIIIDKGWKQIAIEDVNFYLLPFGINQELWKHEILNDKENCSYGVNIIVAHDTLQGSQLSNGKTLDGSGLDFYRNFDYAALGDIHQYQQLESNICYSGNMIKTRFGERDGRYIIIDVNSKRIKSTHSYPIKDRPYIIHKQGSIITDAYEGAVVRVDLDEKITNIGEFLENFKTSTGAKYVTYKIGDKDTDNELEEIDEEYIDIEFWQVVKDYLRKHKINRETIKYIVDVKKRYYGIDKVKR